MLSRVYDEIIDVVIWIEKIALSFTLVSIGLVYGEKEISLTSHVFTAKMARFWRKLWYDDITWQEIIRQLIKEKKRKVR